jgi:ATP-dependent RNA/DNA helicase IGHMBP2
MSYFQQLQSLLTLEQTTDREQYQALIANTSIVQRRENGIAWYPIAIRDVEITKGDYINVTIERTTNKDEPHQLRFGMPAILFSNHDAKQHKIEGIISHCRGNQLKINIRIEELPDWSRDGKLGIDLLFDENSYQEMFTALKVADKKYAEPQERLINLLAQEPKNLAANEIKKTTSNNTISNYFTKNLNPYQDAAVQKIIHANELAIVHGPPGTGKTTTLIQAIKGLLANGCKKILVTAPSNTAVDVVSEKLHAQGVQVVRIGNPVRVNEALLSLTMDNKIAEHETTKNIKKLKKQANEFKDMAHKYKRSFGKAERDQRKALFDEAYKIMKDVEVMEKYITDDVLNKAQVITATLVGSNHFSIRHLHYDAVIIDEAGQAMEPACWIPILKTQKLILAGDHCQLPPTIKSHEAAKKGLEQTLLEKCVALHPEAVTLLQEQYRMHEHIMQYSSNVFYNNQLIANEHVQQHLLFEQDKPFTFIDTAGCGFEELVNGKQINNKEEASLLFKHLVNYVQELQQQQVEPFPSIAIISPYKQQIVALQEYLGHVPELQAYLPNIKINTIDSFQGQEKDIIYISLVRSNSENNIGFLADIRRMNVAMTRARKKLVIIGDSATLGSNPFYENLINYAQQIDGWVSAWEFM